MVHCTMYKVWAASDFSAFNSDEWWKVEGIILEYFIRLKSYPYSVTYPRSNITKVGLTWVIIAIFFSICIA